MTLEQVDTLFAYWRSSPPVHELVAAYMGVKPEEPQGPVVTDADRAFVEKMRARLSDG